jgi:ubiquitin carboxyl-terminal hydrolase L3
MIFLINSNMSWPALESDPEIFTEYFRSLGLSPTWEFGEVFSMDEEVEGSALILVHRTAGDGPGFLGVPIPSRYFIKQLPALDNACGLIAGLHGILNSDAEIIEGSALHQLKLGIEDKSAAEAGELLVGNQRIQNAHAAFASEGQSATTNSPTHHFIAILPGLKLYDGMRESVLELGQQPGFLSFFSILQNLIEVGSISQDISLMVLRKNL